MNNTIDNNEIKTIIDSIKSDIKTTQVKTAMQVNSNLIMLYFRVGKILSDNYKYGNKLIENVSKNLKITYPDSKGFSIRNLKYMKKFYVTYRDDKLVQQLVAQVPWGHNIVLMDKLNDNETRKIYLEAIIKNNWGREMLIHQISTDYHKRIGKSDNNFELTLPKYDSDLANYTFKSPYIFDFISLDNDYKEKELEKIMIEKIKQTLLELGKGFSFVGNQYKISVGNEDYYIDLLFYHLELRCYVVVELKVTKFKPEYIGQLGFYVTAVDEILKKPEDNQTIGLLLCKEKNKLTVDYSLKNVNKPIGVSSYELYKHLPEKLVESLPSEEELNLHINLDELEDDSNE